MKRINDQITELNQNYNDLGEDLLLLEAVVLAAGIENEFPEEYIASSLKRMEGCIRQHTEDIQFLANLLHREAASAPYPGAAAEVCRKCASASASLAGGPGNHARMGGPSGRSAK